MLAYGRPVYRQSQRQVLKSFNTKFSATWSHVLYIALEDDVTAFQWCQFWLSLSRCLSKFSDLFGRFSQNPILPQWRTTLAIWRVMSKDRLFDNLTDKSYWNVDDWNNVDLLRIITRGSKYKCQLTLGVFSISFAMSVIEKVGEFLNTLTMQYELQYKWWINAIVMILSVPHCLCWLFYFQNIITFLFEKLTCAVEILIWSDAVDVFTKSRECRTQWSQRSRPVVLKWLIDFHKYSFVLCSL